jgi:hypothetical protein
LELNNADVRVYVFTSYYGSTKSIPKHVIERYYREFEPYKGERYMEYDLRNKKIIDTSLTDLNPPVLPDTILEGSETAYYH